MPERLGEAVRRLRVGAGLSQNRLARLAGIDPAYVNRLEARPDVVRPSRTVVLAVAEALELDALATDRLLYVAGHAPVIDWQAVALDQARRLDAVADALAGYGGLPIVGASPPEPCRRPA